MRNTEDPSKESQEIKVTDRRRPVGEAGARAFLEQADKPAETKTLSQMVTDCFLEPGPGTVVVQPDEFTYRGRVIVPNNAKRTGQTGVVVKVGTECSRQFWGWAPTGGEDNADFRTYRPLRVGDHVVYGMWTGTQLQFENRPSYRILFETEILSLVNKNATKLTGVEA